MALSGQRRVRIAKAAETPITATVLALESRDGEDKLEQAVMVSCDLVAIRSGIVAKVREKAGSRLPDFDLHKLLLNGTHTHTAPVMLEGRYMLPDKGVMEPGEYAQWMTDRVADAIVDAWQKRAPGKVAWGQDHAVVGRDRRAVYADGTARMYGSANTPSFRGIEGYEDHSVDVLLCWDEQDRLIATAINVVCPAQEVEGRSAINADYRHPVVRIRSFGILANRHRKAMLARCRDLLQAETPAVDTTAVDRPLGEPPRCPHRHIGTLCPLREEPRPRFSELIAWTYTWKYNDSS